MTAMLSALRRFGRTLNGLLLPADCDDGYTPYVMLSYLGIFFFSYFFRLPPAPELMLGLASVLVFLLLYFRIHWVSSGQAAWYIGAMWLLGMVIAEINFGSSVYVVYSGAFCIRLGSVRRAATGLIVIIVASLLAAFILDLPKYFWIPSIFLCAIIGGINIYFREMELKNQALKLSQQEITRLATATERERIARDLHDLIGHTFSVITLKAELANRLMDVDVDRARRELKDLENLSRDSLSQVREAVSGYRESDLATELVNARLALEAKDIRFDYRLPENPLPEHLDREFAIILREGITNIIRHSDASQCRVSVLSEDGDITLEIHDNGHSEQFDEGNGLKGIRERAAAIKGHFSIDIGEGTSLQIQVPA